jgi:hypothetical protein
MHRQDKLTLAVARPVLSVVIGLFVLAFGVLASGAAVHHALHHHSTDHSANCAICSFVKGMVEATDAPVPACQPVWGCLVAAMPIIAFPPQNPSFLLPPGRAPPILSVAS